MKRLVAIAVVLAVCAPRVSEAQRAPAQKPKIAVFPFLDRSRGIASATPTPLSLQVADALIIELAKLQRYDVVERSTLEKVIAEKKLNIADMSDPTAAADAAKVVGATHILTGTIPEAAPLKANAGFKVTLDTRLIEVRSTGNIWATSTEGVEAMSAGWSPVKGVFGPGPAEREALLTRAARRAVTKLLYEFVWFLDKARVPVEAGATVRTDKFYLDLGSKAGIASGDTFEVKMLGKPFVAGGKEIREETKIGTVSVDQVEPDFSTAPVTPELSAKAYKKDSKGKASPNFDLLSLRRLDPPAAAPAPAAPPTPVPIEAPAPTPAPMSVVRAPMLVAFVSNAQGILRATPAATGTAVVTLKKEAQLEVTELKAGWCKVKTADGKEGWIIATAISTEKPQPQP